MESDVAMGLNCNFSSLSLAEKTNWRGVKWENLLISGVGVGMFMACKDETLLS